MDHESERAWQRFLQAEKAYREAMADLRDVDMLGVLREGLLTLPWRGPALAVLNASDPALSEQLLPELFRLASVSHGLIGEVRRCIRRVPREVLVVYLEAFVRRLVDDSHSDYEAYRRIAELLRELEFQSALDILVGNAAASSDADIREVAEDFG